MKKNISNIHLEVLDRGRQELLEKLLPYSRDFVLGGGTAISLQIAHRKSFDFDFFSKAKIKKELLEKLKTSVPIANISTDSGDELTFFTTEEIKVTFLHYPFDYAFPLVEVESGLRLFSLKDIAIQKAYTVGRRGEYRDYFDLYVILKSKHILFPNLISEAKKIYGSIFEEKIFLEQLVYFGDLLDFGIKPAKLKPLPKPEEAKEFFEDLVKKYIE